MRVDAAVPGGPRPAGWRRSRLGMVLSLGLAAACVGGEPGGRSAEESTATEASKPGPVVRAAFEATDEVPPLRYQIFERVTLSKQPHKMLYRLLVMQPGPREALVKTMRTALDSIAGSDTTLVAARAILYAYRPTGQADGDVVPVVWGERVPPEGWAAATGSRQGFQRTHVYHGVPAWSVEDSSATPSGTER